MMQALRSSLLKLLRDDKALPTQESAWSEVSAMYSFKDFEKYNPDDLIGRKGHAIYRKMMRDEQVKAVIKFKRDAITSRDWNFVIKDTEGVLTDEEKATRIGLSERIVEKMVGSWMDVMNGILSAIYNGFSMTEIVFGMVEYNKLSYWGLESLKLKPFDTFYFKVDDYGNVLEVGQRIAGKSQELDSERFLHFVVNPDIDEHYGGSELREAYRAWFSKDIAIKYYNIWLEKHAGGFRYAQPIEGRILVAGTPEHTALQNILSNINTATGAILPGGIELKGENPSSKVAYEVAIEKHDTAIARALLVPNLLGVSPQGDTGSYSQSTNQIEAFEWTLKADSNRLEDGLNEQVFRPLGEANFGDDLWPRFKFKPASGQKKLETIKLWKDLVSGKAVRATNTDEQYVRELLEFPEAGEEEIKDESGNVDSGDSDGGSNDDDSANDEEGEQEDGSNTEDSSGSEETETPEDKTKEVDASKAKNETVIGAGQVKITAFQRALERVDFKVIERGGDAITLEYSRRVAFDTDLIVEDLITKLKKEGDVTEEVKSNIKALKVNPKLKTKLNGTITRALKEGFALGTKHAMFEIDKAKKEPFSIGMNRERLEFLAKDFLKLTSFKITGDLIGRIQSIVTSELLNGSKIGRSLDDIELAIYDNLASTGLLSIDKFKSLLEGKEKVTIQDTTIKNSRLEEIQKILSNELLDEDEKVDQIETISDLALYQIESIVNTANFAAINEARYQTFTDPKLDGFVTGFEYSAILDSRTTNICRHLDSDNAGNHSTAWYKANARYKPPNHYNCRSVLIPVTQADSGEFKEGPQPTITPASGFG